MLEAEIEADSSKASLWLGSRFQIHSEEVHAVKELAVLSIPWFSHALNAFRIPYSFVRIIVRN